MIALEQVSVEVGDFRLENISLHIPTGDYGILMGRTGCGKTTLMEAICGLKPVRAGVVRIGGRDVTNLKPAARGIGYVPQDGALFTSMTVYEHLAFALRLRRWEKGALDERVRGLAGLLGITALLERRPPGLSGGESQRVALGRALSFHPQVLCLDEPLSALDHETRVEIAALLASLRREMGVTVLHITHDPNEAKRLAQHRFRLEAGAIHGQPVTQDTGT